jgi:RNA polymerase sigma factor (sigma-70 family)
MVFGVCRRILGNIHDAEDAFQATFLVLARKAASVRPRVPVGAWLYGVAYRTALEARTKINRRCTREQQVEEMPEPEEREQSSCNELLSLLDREVHRLPDKYRLPVVLCDLEGRSRKEVARQMGIPEGTLSSRLATAHKKLAWLLSRFGLSVSGASVAVLLAQNAASANVPPILKVATVKAVLLLTAGQVAGISAGIITLTEGVLRTMFIAKVKTTTLMLCGVATLSLGTGGLLYQTRVGAADSPRPGQNRIADQREAIGSGVNGDDEEARQNDRAKLAAEREKALLEELERARKEAMTLRMKAEADQRRAVDALQALREQLAKAQAAERRALYVNQMQQAQQAFDSKQVGRQPVDRLDELEAKTREQFQRQRQALMEQMKKLEVEEQVTLRKLAAERSRSLPTKQQSGDRETPPVTN